MFSALSLLVLTCAITINAQNPQCGETLIGTVPTSHAVNLLPANLPPHIADFEVTIPPITECAYSGGVAGVHAFMCDTDTAPTGGFIDYNKMKVHRNGNLLGYGSVTVTVYCNY